MGKLGQGGAPVTTLLQGLEHNGVNRPLAGLAQALEAFTNPTFQSYSTSNRGNISASNDFLSLVNLGRIAGGKPLDEALAQDAGFRFKVYDAKDSARRELLGEAIKTTMMAGNTPSTEQVDTFTKQYLKAGGKQEGFNKFFMSTYKQANVSQANVIAESLKSPYSKDMQKLMGGYEMKDFTNTPASP
jgi:hypothetical protein